MYRILFVCTANVCRSPMAEAIVNHKIEEEGAEERLWAESSGIWANEGTPASSMTQMVAAEEGLDLSGHRSTPITPHLIKTSDLILCMTPSHKRDLLQIFPHLEKKIFTLREFGRLHAPQKQAIDDPIGMNLNFYRRIYSELKAEIDRIWPILLEASYKKLMMTRDA